MPRVAYCKIVIVNELFGMNCENHDFYFLLIIIKTINGIFIEICKSFFLFKIELLIGWPIRLFLYKIFNSIYFWPHIW